MPSRNNLLGEVPITGEGCLDLIESKPGHDQIFPVTNVLKPERKALEFETNDEISKS